eukprot:gene12103-8652_t
MATYAKLIHNGKIQTVALIEGLEAEEVTALLKTVFGISGNIVGIMAEKGLVIPISLVCRSPQIIPNTTCKILVAKSTDANESASAPTVSGSASSRSAVIADAEDIVDEDSSSDDEDDEAAAQSVVDEISQFLDNLRRKNVLNSAHHALLRRLLKERSALLFAAYSVAVSAGDPEYLTEICKDIANSLQTDEGRTACEAQDEVLQVCDQLYLQGKITESQLLYLRHLTLIRDGAIANVYDEFQEHNSVTLFAKALYDKDISSGLIGVIVLMLRTETISRTEAQVLLEMVQREDDYVMAAYELFLRDNNMDDLQDTLMRCVRLEIRKRVTDIQERELSALQRERDLEKAQEKTATYDEATDAGDDDDADVDSEDYESGKVATRDFGLEAISLESLLNELGVEQQWKGSVPDQFVQAVFIAVYRKFLSVEQARALCDLFQANYDLVHAAWEVYVVQKDTVDFIDTVRRVVRDLNVQEIQQSESAAREEATKAERTAERTKETAREARESATKGQQAAQEARAKAAEVEEAKSKALQAISQAKSDLLKHSLDMMVKQKLVTEKSADDLYQRHLEGDKLTDAAIEAYAADRDVNEFVDTLQMLASHSKEELDVLMGSAIAEQESQEQNGGASSTAAVADAEAVIAQRFLADAALQQIEEIVSEMLKNDMISPPVASAFARLITDRDERLVEAYQQFMKNRNGTELIDTLLKVVIASVQSGVRAAAASEATSSTKSSPSRGASATATGGAQVLDKADQKQIVDILFQSNALSAQQYGDICRMIEDEDVQLSRIFRKYETTKDVMHLVQDLQRRFMQIIQNMSLSELEQTALRLAIAENDPAIRNAIDAFRSDLNEDRLVLAMRTAARAVIHRTLSSASRAEDDEEDDEENNVKENIISRQDGAIIMKQFADNNPIVSTALDLYDTNNDMAKLVEALQQMVDNIRDESS